MSSEAGARCRVCGLELREQPWGFDGTTPLYDYCPCCGVEFGYQDASPTGARNYRARWLATGAEWAARDERPSHWDIDEQLKHVPLPYR